MKYKIGDKVKIKTWKALKKEFRQKGEHIYCNSRGLMSFMEKDLQRLHCDRILTIKEIVANKDYNMKEISCVWNDEMIECLVEEPNNPINSRWEILDIR